MCDFNLAKAGVKTQKLLRQPAEISEAGLTLDASETSFRKYCGEHPLRSAMQRVFSLAAAVRRR
jgi:hypothetical protein